MPSATVGAPINVVPIFAPALCVVNVFSS
jgi:hypothetical protein